MITFQIGEAVFIRYFSFHVWIHGFGSQSLCRDDADKFEMVRTLAKTCLDTDRGLFGYDALHTHLHFMFGLRWGAREDPPAGWAVVQIKDFCHLLRRRYGAYFRHRYPHFKGDLFAREHDNFTASGNPDAFVAQLKYLHHNSVGARIFDVYEENPFCSFPLYLSAFVHNPEIQNVPIVRAVSQNPAYLPIYDALDMEYALGQFRGHFDQRVRNFIKQHESYLQYRSRNAQHRHNQLGVGTLFRDADALQIANTSGHQVLRLIDQINGRKSELLLSGASSPQEASDTFRSFFPFDEDTVDVKKHFLHIRDQYPDAFQKFIQALGQTCTQRGLSAMTGICRANIKTLLTQ